MSATIVRLMLSFITIAATPAVYFALVLIIYENSNAPFSISRFFFAASVTTLITAGLLILTWLAIWFRQVRWTGRRVAATVIVSAGAAAGAAVVGVAMGAWEDEAGPIAGGVAFALLWLAGVTLAWRETAAERADRLRTLGVRAVACPRCGYNMTGLLKPVCPECGASFTLDEFVAAIAEDRDGVAG